MGAWFSCPFAKCSDIETGLEAVIVKSINFGDDEEKTPVRSISFKGRDSEPTILKSSGLGRMIFEGSVSFKGRELERMHSTKPTSSDKENNVQFEAVSPKRMVIDAQSPKSDGSEGSIQQLPVLDLSNPKHEAAMKLQKVYKSFRTRRKLADCAVLIEQGWWKLLDFAELKWSSISFFDIEKHETAVSRWSRARTRAAKVGKGLSKNGKAQKLALQHWLEAIDPRHRYGHNLHFYYDKWLNSQSEEPFFCWLDIGEGKEVNLEACPRLKLQQQCIKYPGPMERIAYEVIVLDGKFLFKQTGELLHTTGNAKWIFVLSTSKTLYVGQKKKGTFQHSSFLAGGATIAAGRLVVEDGVLKAVWPHSGNYQPTPENFKDFISFLEEKKLDLTNVKMTAADEEEGSIGNQRSSKHLRCSSSEEDLDQTLKSLDTEEIAVKDLVQGETDSVEETTVALEHPKSRSLRNRSGDLTYLEIPKRAELSGSLQNDHLALGQSCNDNSMDSPVEDNHRTSKEAFATQLQMVDGDCEDNEHIDQVSILQRMNSKEVNSYQLGKQLSCKWTTGAGPRIGCVRDYPSELQSQALEQVNLSPRSASHLKPYYSPRSPSCLSPKVSSPLCCGEEMTGSPMLKKGSLLERSIPYRTQSSPLLKEALVGAINGVS
ncbi:hypothetical protein SLE2022_007880 [Rubroshorea leprosula]